MIVLKDFPHNLNSAYFFPVLGTFFSPENGDDNLSKCSYASSRPYGVRSQRTHLEMNLINKYSIVQLHNEELHNLHYVPSIIRIVKTWACNMNREEEECM
jgi:hypothetical protein